MRDETDAEKGHWLGATYDCDFVRRADAWKIKSLDLNIQQIVPYATPPT